MLKAQVPSRLAAPFPGEAESLRRQVVDRFDASAFSWPGQALASTIEPFTASEIVTPLPLAKSP